MAKKRLETRNADNFRVQRLSRVIHEKARLGILTTLAANPSGLLFTDLKQLVELTDGNLSRHLKVLVEAKMIQTKKTNRGRNSKSTYRLTKQGIDDFSAYLDNLESVLQRASAAAKKVRQSQASELELN